METLAGFGFQVESTYLNSDSGGGLAAVPLSLETTFYTNSSSWVIGDGEVFSLGPSVLSI